LTDSARSPAESADSAGLLRTGRSSRSDSTISRFPASGVPTRSSDRVGCGRDVGSSHTSPEEAHLEGGSTERGLQLRDALLGGGQLLGLGIAGAEGIGASFAVLLDPASDDRLSKRMLATDLTDALLAVLDLADDLEPELRAELPIAHPGGLPPRFSLVPSDTIPFGA